MSILVRERCTLTDSLITHAHDPYWDAATPRREVQNAVESIDQDFAMFRKELGILRVSIKFLLDKLGVSQAEMETYAARKKAEMESVMKAQEEKVGSDKQLSEV